MSTQTTSDKTDNADFVSVIVPSFNRAHYLPGALQSLTAQQTDGRFRYEVVVVDNASTDNTQQVVAEFAKSSPVPVRCLYESRPGDAPPRNKGIRNTSGRWLAFFDDDQFATETWLLNLLSTADNNGAKIVGGPVHLDLEAHIREQLSPACRSTLRECIPYAHDCPYEPGVIPGTGNLLVARSVFESVGLFAEDIPEGGSDWKLVNDARTAGFAPWYSAAASIRHRVEPNRMTRDYFRWDARNGGVTAADFDSKKYRLPMLALRACLRAARAVLHLPLHMYSLGRPPAIGCRQSSMVVWRTEGYLRRCLTQLAPALFAQKAFYKYVDFRTGRAVGT